MKQFLTIAGIGVGLYGLYLLFSKDSCGCDGKKAKASRYVVKARKSLGGVRGNGAHRAQNVPIMADSMREVFDARPVSTCCPSVAFPNFMYPDDTLDDAHKAIANL